MLEQKEAVIFDLDGTLVDSMWVWVTVDAEYIENFHLTVPDDFYEKIEGKSFTETAEYYLDIFPEIHKTLEELKAEWYEMALHKYTHEVCLKEGVREFLAELRNRNIKTAIATSNDRKLAEATLEALKIQDLIDVVCTSCEVNKGKPSPDVYLAAAGKLKIKPEYCLVFEDVPNGILAGKNAGMTVCAVDDTFSRPQEKKKRELADYYIYSYYDIANQTFEVL
ncbi:MAG: HAD family phosphatase [Bariatricus sp.]|nr:HAD family phosphatase [Bariatricus sp.]